MKKLLRNLLWLIVALLLMSAFIALLKLKYSEHNFYWTEFGDILELTGSIGIFIFILYVPAIRGLQLWWKKSKKKNHRSKWFQSQTARSFQKFIMNGAAMAGSLTIIYAFLMALFAHLLAPDSSPYANDQINEIAYQQPGFKIQVLEIPLALQAEDKNFFHDLIYGKRSNIKQVPFYNRYWYANDSMFISRFIGTGVKGVTTGYSLEEITGRKLATMDQIELIESEHISNRKFLLGTDDLGRDYLSRLLLGVRVSLSIGFVAVIIALFIGIPVGAFAGFYKSSPPLIKFRRKRSSEKKINSSFKVPVDDMIMWIINVIWAVPTLLLVFPIVFAFGQNYYTIFIAVGLTMWVDIARIVRSQVMQVRELEFVQAAKTFAFSDLRTIFIHILPNISGPVIVITAANFAYAILTEAGLSFLGIGVQPPAPSWGLMISKFKDNLITDPYLPLLPGFAITILVLAFFMIGNGLRDALDVKTRIEH